MAIIITLGRAILTIALAISIVDGDLSEKEISYINEEIIGELIDMELIDEKEAKEFLDNLPENISEIYELELAFSKIKSENPHFKEELFEVYIELIASDLKVRKVEKQYLIDIGKKIGLPIQEKHIDKWLERNR